MAREIDIACRVVRDHLRANVPLRNDQCWCRTDERVPPSLGEHFVSVYPSEYSISQSPDPSEFQDRSQAVSIGITHRTGAIPLDRVYKYAFARDPKGVGTLAEEINRIIERDRWTLLGAMNSLDPEWDFVEPLRLSSGDLGIRIVDEEHFCAPPDTARQPSMERYFGLFTELQYAAGRIMRTFLESAPVSRFTWEVDVDDSRLIRFRNVSQGPLFSHSWQFGDNSGDVVNSPEHRYDAPGSYAVNLTVTGPGGTNKRGRTVVVE